MSIKLFRFGKQINDEWSLSVVSSIETVIVDRPRNTWFSGHVWCHSVELRMRNTWVAKRLGRHSATGLNMLMHRRMNFINWMITSKHCVICNCTKAITLTSTEIPFRFRSWSHITCHMLSNRGHMSNTCPGRGSLL